MNNKVDILGVKFNKITMDETVEKVVTFLNSDGQYTIFTPNPEIVMAALEDEELKVALDCADLVIPDGIGIVIGSRILKDRLPERVAGCDLIENIFSKIKNQDKTVYFFGAGPGIPELASKKMIEKHTGLEVVGLHNGYFDLEEEKSIIEDINEKRPDILLVGLGAPKQEKWINKNKNKLNVRIIMGVGGSIDIMSGTVKRAPLIFQKLGLEWFHRLIIQPTRAKRMIQLPKFLIRVINLRKSKV